MIATLRERLRSWRLEHKIDAMSARCARESAAGMHDQARSTFLALRLLVSQRSPEQVARLKRARGLR